MDACWKVQRALDEKGIEYEVVKHGFGKGKAMRAEVVEVSGQHLLPVLELSDGTVYRAESDDWPPPSGRARSPTGARTPLGRGGALPRSPSGELFGCGADMVATRHSPRFRSREHGATGRATSTS